MLVFAEATADFETATMLADRVLVERVERVLEVLTEGDQERTLRCIQQTAIEDLCARGTENGLADYMRELDDGLVPMLTRRD